MMRLSVAVLSAVLLSACGGGEDPKDLTQQQQTGTTVQSGTVGETADSTQADKDVPNKRAGITTPHSQTPQTN